MLDPFLNEILFYILKKLEENIKNEYRNLIY